MNEVEKTLELLYSKFGSNICLAPFVAGWYSTSTTTSSSILRPCSVAHGDWSFNSGNIIDGINSQKWINLRKDFVSGKFANNGVCYACSNTERQGALSMRQLGNKSMIEHCSVDVIDKLNQIISNNYIQKEIYVLEYFPSNYCNYSCIMCNSNASTSRATFEKQILKRFVIPQTQKELATDFYQVIKNLNILNFAGGETLMQPDVHRMIDYLIDEKLSENIIITFLTNVSSFPEEYVGKFKKFKDVFYTLSIDGTGEIIEYQRRGANWDEVSANAIKINQNFGSILNFVLTSVNVFNFVELVDWAYKNNIDIVFVSPENSTQYLDLESLPDELKNKAIAQLSLAKNNYTVQWPIDLLDNVINILQTVEFKEYKLKEFIKRIKIEDSVSKKPLSEIVPEWKPYFE